MLFERDFTSPYRDADSVAKRFDGPDKGLITAWEVGRKMRAKNHHLLKYYDLGALPMDGFKGGAFDVEAYEKALKEGTEYEFPVTPLEGTLHYLAQLQGLKGENLSVDTDKEYTLTCKLSNRTCKLTNNASRYAK